MASMLYCLLLSYDMKKPLTTKRALCSQALPQQLSRVTAARHPHWFHLHGFATVLSTMVSSTWFRARKKSDLAYNSTIQ